MRIVRVLGTVDAIRLNLCAGYGESLFRFFKIRYYNPIMQPGLGSHVANPHRIRQRREQPQAGNS